MKRYLAPSLLERFDENMEFRKVCTNINVNVYALLEIGYKENNMVVIMYPINNNGSF